MRKVQKMLSMMLALTLLLSVSLVASAQNGPSVTARSQMITDGTVTIAEVVAEVDGWMVIHAQAPKENRNDPSEIGEVVGYAPVSAGVNEDVVVEVDLDRVTDTLYAMLHVDEGEIGVYEFPGPDGPVFVDGEVLAPPFSVVVMGGSPAAAAAEAERQAAAAAAAEAAAAEAAAAEAAAAEAEEMPNIVELALAAEGLETLVAAVQAADLVDVLSGEGPFTVFAPTDDAFMNVGDLLADLLADPSGALTDVLLYHVVAGAVFSSDLEDGMEVATVGGGIITISVSDEGVMINNANVIAPDIVASNGVVHVIDAVLIPEAAEAPGEEEPAPEPTPAPTEEPAEEPAPEPTATPEPEAETPDIVDIAVAAGDFETLVAAVTAAGLVDTLKGDGPFTVFAPTDAAFNALPAGLLDDLLADPSGALTDVLLFHVVSGAVFSSDLSDGMTVTTVGGGTLTVGVSADGVTINDARVVVADIEASNGVIHVIDMVLVPAADGDTPPDTLPVTGASAAELAESGNNGLFWGLSLLVLILGAGFVVMRRRMA